MPGSLRVGPAIHRAAAFALATFTTAVSPAGSAGPGQWSPHHDLGDIAIHMAVVPGTGTSDHSRVVWWAGRTAGGVLGWNPGTENCASSPSAWLTPRGWPVPDPYDDPFCSGHVITDQLVTLGGSDGFQWGLRAAHAYDPAMGSAGGWVAKGPMTTPRWYATGTVLRSGQVIVSSGHKYHHLWLYGGRRDGQAPPPAGGGASGYLVDRLGRQPSTRPGDPHGKWDSSEETRGLQTGGLRPVPRESHSLAYLDLAAVDTSIGRAQALFGGTGNGGGPVDDLGFVWYLRRHEGTTLVPEMDSEYRYEWNRKPAGATRPVPRSEHAAVSIAPVAQAFDQFTPTEMVVFGGADASGVITTPDEQFWHLRRIGAGQFEWGLVAASGAAPSPRYGHAAAYDPATRRMFLFGGAGTVGGSATDATVHVFTFDHVAGFVASGTWSTIGLGPGSPVPEPRRDHSMVFRPADGTLWVFGGHLGSAPPTGQPADAVWILPVNAPSPQWSAQAPATRPAARAGHSAVYDYNTDRMEIFGGDPTQGGQPDVAPWFFRKSGISYVWDQGVAASPSFHLSQHTAGFDPRSVGNSTGGAVFARSPELWNPTTSTWTLQTNTHWRQSWYPLQFVVPGGPNPGGGRVLAVGRDRFPPRYLDIPPSGLAGQWQDLHPNHPGFAPGAGVSYSPGKLMVAGGAGNHPIGGAFGLLGAVATLDVTAGNGWQSRPWMFRRKEHDLVTLPTGQVLALGGMTSVGESTLAHPDSAVRCPQMWDPVTGTWTYAGDLPGGGADQPCDLAVEPDVRNYHSVAVLLPDSRVLRAGGWPLNEDTWPPGNPSRKWARLYCPPFLFKADGTTPIDPTDRPEITSAPVSITYGQAFVIGKRTTDAIASACLIAPAANTHGFDQNQRFVPLAFETLADQTGIRALAPRTGGHAPPGHYLLFTVNQNGVPAIARWVRVGNCPTVPCDNEPPPQVADLYADIVGPNEIWLAWSAPGDDVDPAGAYDLRYATALITGENAFHSAGQVGSDPADKDPPPPGATGTPQDAAKLNLSPCTAYHFAIKSSDAKSNWSTTATLATATTCGGGGGGFSAGQVGAGAAALQVTPAEPSGAENREAGLTAGAAGATLAASTDLGWASSMLVAETRRTLAGSWAVTVRRVSEPAGFDPALAGAIVSQIPDGRGGWKTLGRHQPSPAQSPLGLCALRDDGRVVFPSGYVIDRVMSGVRTGSEDLTLSTARHSRLGVLDAAVLAGNGAVEMGLGEGLTLEYSPGAQTVPGAASWYLLVRPGGGTESTASPVRRVLQPGSVPAQFALHRIQPNPSRRTTTLAFELPVATQVTLEVFDPLGRKVTTLVDGHHPAGTHVVEWDLRDAAGSLVAPGVYVCRMAAGEFRARRKMSVVP